LQNAWLTDMVADAIAAMHCWRCSCWLHSYSCRPASPCRRRSGD